MKRIYLIAGLFVISGMPLPVAAADEHMVVVSPDGLKWGAAPPAFPKGAQLTVVSGDPSKEGLYVIRLNLTSGFKVSSNIY